MYPQNNFAYYPQQQQAYARPVQTSTQPTPTALGLKGRPVSSVEEARAMPIDFDGSIFYFPDLANKRIYTKQINMDGTSTLLMYELKEIPVEQPVAMVNTDNYVTRAEFDNVINQLKSLFSSKEEQKVSNSDPVIAESAQPHFNF